jgi:predicted nuclease of predicted toxin-antitoxin system
MTAGDERLVAALYVDADLTTRIVPALRQRGYECCSAVEDGLGDAVDETVLARATELGMVLLTNNDRDFSPMARRWTNAGRNHAGILISEQFRNRELGEFLRRLIRFLDTVTAGEMRNTVRYLSEFR